jgi:hypothetical protein
MTSPGSSYELTRRARATSIVGRLGMLWFMRGCPGALRLSGGVRGAARLGRTSYRSMRQALTIVRS